MGNGMSLVFLPWLKIAAKYRNPEILYLEPLHN